MSMVLTSAGAPTSPRNTSKRLEWLVFRRESPALVRMSVLTVMLQLGTHVRAKRKVEEMKEVIEKQSRPAGEKKAEKKAAEKK